MKFSVKDFSSKCDQIRSFLWIWPWLMRDDGGIRRAVSEGPKKPTNTQYKPSQATTIKANLRLTF